MYPKQCDDFLLNYVVINNIELTTYHPFAAQELYIYTAIALSPLFSFLWTDGAISEEGLRCHFLIDAYYPSIPGPKAPSPSYPHPHVIGSFHLRIAI